MGFIKSKSKFMLTYVMMCVQGVVYYCHKFTWFTICYGKIMTSIIQSKYLVFLMFMKPWTTQYLMLFERIMKKIENILFWFITEGVSYINEII